ncbi:serine carboxypeptidase-like 51 [Silene latifolia]|uniref:serine carboxypeptidase-like 51 n=1 Tax=Silene latifolia TaxID=37657 RepID=UPI003D76D2F1
MAKFSVFNLNSLFVATLYLLVLLNGTTARHIKSNDGLEEWGYVQVRPKAHMFWWLYKSPYRVEDPTKPWPTILWLQGGPGASGTGIGNFQEVGPLDTNLKPRNTTWLKKADLLFVDNPVGTGYSYVEDKKLVVKSDEEAGEDLTRLLIELYNKNDKLQKSPLYIVAESYGGKFAVTFALAAHHAISVGQLKATLGGVALGDSWISPEDFVFSWAPLLKDLSRLDDDGFKQANSLAEVIKQQLKNGSYVDATNTWSELEGTIAGYSNSVDFYNFLLDSSMDPVGSTTTTTNEALSQKLVFGRHSRYLNIINSLSTDKSNGLDLDDLMEGPIKTKLKIIPHNVTWGGQSDLVFTALESDFMKPRIAEVDELLSEGVSVTVYNGQLDLICATKGTQAWVEKLKWDGLKTFLSEERTPLYCEADKGTKGFRRSYKNFHFYWILGAGHFVPLEQPCVALNMIANITQSPAL